MQRRRHVRQPAEPRSLRGQQRRPCRRQAHAQQLRLGQQRGEEEGDSQQMIALADCTVGGRGRAGKGKAAGGGSRVARDE